MSQTDTLTGRRLTISDLGRAPRARQAAATATPKPAPSHHQLRAALGAPRSQVIDLLEWWTAQPSYIAAIAAGGMRWNLDGSEAGEISDEHRAHAEKQLKATR
jgi:hypothetical protein